MKMDLHGPLLNNVESVAKYEMGQRVYINLPDGDMGIVFAYIVFETHIEYLIRTLEQGIMQLDATCLSDTRPIELD